MRDLSPRKKLLHTQPGPVRAQPLQLQELPHLLDGRIGLRRADAAGALIREGPDLPGDKWQPGKFAQQALVQVRWDGLPIPEPSPFQHRGNIRAHFLHRQPTTC
jgi:hypothetical protein